MLSLFIRFGCLFVLSIICIGNSSSKDPERCFIDPVWNRTDIVVNHNVLYGSAYNNYTKKVEKLYLDVYTPNNDQREKRPGMVLIHGGSFTTGDKNLGWEPELARELVQRGFIVFSINYRLTGKYWGVISPPGECCPGTTSDQYIRDASHDLKAAVRFMRKNASELRIDVDRIGIIGTSAGAITVEFTAYVSDIGEGQSGNPGYGSQVSVAVPISGELRYDAFCTGFDDAGIPYGCQYGIWNETNAINSAKQPPLAMVHGTLDLTVPIIEAESIQKRANEVSLKNKLIKIIGGRHVPIGMLLNEGTYMVDLMMFIVEAMKLKDVPSECPKA